MINVADYETKRIKTEEIYASPRALRDVNQEDEQFKELARDIGNRGVIQNIVVREVSDDNESVPSEFPYELCDGAQRLACANLNGISELNCTTLPSTISNDDLLVIQMGLNLHRVDTKPAAYAKQIKRLILTAHERDDFEKSAISYWADQFSKSEQWVKDRLRLTHLSDEEQVSLDKGEIPIANAIMLSKMNPELRKATGGDGKTWSERAQSMDTKGFTSQSADAIKSWNKGQKEAAGEPTLQPRLKTLRETKEFLAASRAEFENLDREALELAKDTDDFKMGEIAGTKGILEIIMNVDAASQEKFQRNREQRKVLAEESKKRTSLDSAKKALEDAQKKMKEAEEAAKIA